MLFYCSAVVVCDTVMKEMGSKGRWLAAQVLRRNCNSEITVIITAATLLLFLAIGFWGVTAVTAVICDACFSLSPYIILNFQSPLLYQLLRTL